MVKKLSVVEAAGVEPASNPTLGVSDADNLVKRIDHCILQIQSTLDLLSPCLQCCNRLRGCCSKLSIQCRFIRL
jgi:hypothetical protein